MKKSHPNMNTTLSVWLAGFLSVCLSVEYLVIFLNPFKKVLAKKKSFENEICLSRLLQIFANIIG